MHILYCVYENVFNKNRNYPLIGTIEIKAFAHLFFLKEGSPASSFAG